MSVATAPTTLSDAAIRAYRDDGIVFPLQALTPAETAPYLAQLEDFEAAYGPRAREILRQKAHVVLTWVDALVRLEPVLDVVEQLIGPDILCWATSFFIKDPGDGRFVTWHQDSQYWGLEADDVVSVWLALTPSHRGNGCMRVVPGSHRALVPHADNPERDNLLTRGQSVTVPVDEVRALDIVLAPGQYSLHHERIIHGSAPNAGGERRIGLATRYLRPTAKQVAARTDTATLVRGTDRFGNFGPEPRPRRDMDPADVAWLEALLAVRNGGAHRRKYE